jgi:hypothetical protein
MADLSTPLKGVAYDLGFSLYKNDGTVIANPGTYTKKIWKDGGTIADIAGSVTETDTTYGTLVVTLSATEMTADRVQVHIKDDTAGCVPFTATLYPAAAAVTSALITDAVWDEVLTGATHNVASSAGRRVRQLASNVISTEVLPSQAGVTVNQVKLAATESAVDHIYEQSLVTISADGSGVGQMRLVVNYVGSTKVCTLNRDWDVVPEVDDEYTVYAFSGFLFANQGIATAATASTISLATTASAITGAYIGSEVYITTGTGAGQTRLISGYAATGKVATVSPDWTTTPDATSAYVVIPVGRSIVDSTSASGATALATSLLDHDVTGHTTADTVGEALNTIDDIEAKTTSITAGSVTFTGPVLTSDAVEIVQGADYNDDDDMALEWSDTDWPTLTGGTVYLVLKEGVSDADETYTMTVSSASAVMLEFTNAQTDLMDEGTHDFWIIAYLNTTPVRRVPLVHGMWTVTVPPEVSP